MHELRLVRRPRQDGIEWTSIEGDNAFDSVLEGSYAYMNVFKEICKPNGVAVQAGGYCGIFPYLLSDLASIVYTFEADLYNYTCLEYNLEHLPKKNGVIVPYNAALGKTEGELVRVVRRLDQNLGMHQVVPDSAGDVSTYTIDSLQLPNCVLIQLDTEGYEYNILQGAVKTIEKYHPVISVEDTNADIETILYGFGYKKYIDVYRDTIYRHEE